MYDTILVPTDGSEHAVRAAEHASYLAGTFDATVHVINVVDLAAAAGPFDAGGVDEEYVERLDAEGERSIAAVEQALGDAGNLQTAVVHGEPREEILAYADEHDADLIAMGTHGRTGLDHLVAGSVAEGVLRLAEMPVVTATATGRSRVEGDYDDVLVPTDGSELATAAVDHAIAMAEAGGAHLHAVNVVDVRAMAASPDFSAPTNVIHQLEEDGREATDEIAERAREAGLDVTTDVIEGSPADALLKYADEATIDLITMGTAGRTGLNRFILGSTAERVVRRSEVPVLTVNGHPESGD